MSERREPFLKAPLAQLIMDDCRYVLSDLHFVNSIDLKETYTYSDNGLINQADNSDLSKRSRESTSSLLTRFPAYI